MKIWLLNHKDRQQVMDHKRIMDHKGLLASAVTVNENLFGKPHKPLTHMHVTDIGVFFYCWQSAILDRWPVSRGDTLYTGCKYVIRTFPFVHFIFTSLLLTSFMELSLAVFLVYRRLVGGAHLDLKSLCPKKLTVFAMLCEDHFVHGRAWALPEWRYFVDKMLQASYLFIKIAAMKERDKISPV